MKKGVWGAFIKDSRGSVAIIAALGLAAFLGMASLAVDLGQLYTVRNNLQNTADAAALAAAGVLVSDQGLRDSSAATTAAKTVAQRQSELAGLPSVPQDSRTDLTILFGEWNDRVSPSTAWTKIGSSCDPYSNANAVQVTLRRAAGFSYGPVTNFFAGILGFKTSEVQAAATAYRGYISSAPPNVPGGVNVPLALPTSVLTAANPDGRSWFADLFCAEAVASGPKQFTFKDLGSDTFYQSNLSKPQFDKFANDTVKGYMFLVNNGDPVPGTVVNNLKKNYTSGTAIRPIARGTRLYPISEYQWASNIKDIFQAFKSAYDAKKDSTTHKWRVCVPVYADQNPLAQRLQRGLWNLARLFSLGVPEAQACFTFWTQTYEGGNVPIYVSGFANVDITAVNYVDTCDDCSPYSPAKDGNNYLSTLDCMVRSSLSCRNANSVTVEIPVDSSTVSPYGSVPGGLSNQAINPGAPSNVGAIDAIARLVK